MAYSKHLLSKPSRRELLAVLATASAGCRAKELPDIRSVPADLKTPAVTDGAPAPGKRVRQVINAYKGTGVHHAIYLPEDWDRTRRHPMIVEYAGNGGYKSQYGDVSEGTVEGSHLGYGISGGRRFLWLCLPYVNMTRRGNEALWWGDAAATVDYCKRAVLEVCAEYAGDASAVLLAGFSRGAIACNYIGLRDDEIASLWRGFIPYSHYDGVRTWSYRDSDRASALARLKRLRGRPSFICHERSVDATREYLSASGVKAPFTFQTIHFRNHNDQWVLRDIPERRKLRAWAQKVLRKGTAC